jgi:NADPH2 dehydrogenase
LKTLFSKIVIRKFRFKNRIVMPPMVCFGYATEDGKVTDRNIKHYEARAKGGVGLIIIEATCVSRNGRLSPTQLGLWSDEQIEGFSRIAAVCHQHGARVLVQIHHAGMAVAPGITQDIVAPSNFQGQTRFGQNISARAMTGVEIHKIQYDFVSAALRAQKAGLDGIELHGAHGYLISQFLSPLVNHREDMYGGTPTRRIKFVRDIIGAIRKTAGDNFIIGCRIGCNEPDLKGSLKMAHELEKDGVDLLHISTGVDTLLKIEDQDLAAVPEGFPCNWIVYGATQIKNKVNIPVIAVNGIRTPEQAAYLVEKGLVDFTAIGKGLMVDPEWANKALAKTAITPCLDCKMCSLFRPGAVCPQHASQ